MEDIKSLMEWWEIFTPLSLKIRKKSLTGNKFKLREKHQAFDQNMP